MFWRASDLSLAVTGFASFVIRGLLHARRQLLPIAEVKETVRSAEVDPNVIRLALFVRLDSFAVKQHRLMQRMQFSGIGRSSRRSANSIISSGGELVRRGGVHCQPRSSISAFHYDQ